MDRHPREPCGPVRRHVPLVTPGLLQEQRTKGSRPPGLSERWLRLGWQQAPAHAGREAAERLEGRRLKPAHKTHGAGVRRGSLGTHRAHRESSPDQSPQNTSL